MKKVVAGFCFAAFAIASGNTLASDFYAGLKAGSASKSVNGLSGSNAGIGIFGGYSFNENIALEVGYTDLGTLGFGLTKFSTVEASAVGSLPLNESFSLYGKLGVANTSEKILGISASNTSATYGLGAQYNATPSIGIRLGWDYYKFGGGALNKGNANLYSASALFKF